MKVMHAFCAAVIVAAIPSTLVSTEAFAKVSQRGPVTVFTGTSSAAAIDFKNAKALVLPMSHSIPAGAAAGRAAKFGPPGFSAGEPGDGREKAVRLAPESLADILEDGVAPQDHGTSNHVFTTARVNPLGGNVYRFYPYRATGKLYFTVGSGTSWCSGSMIKPGVVVTAAHCVANYGASQFYSNWQFIPAYQSGLAPYGVWTVQSATIMTSYYNGTDGCAVYGVVCPNDVAVLVLTPQAGLYAGSSTGWYGYGYNGWGFNPSSQSLITQLGYPATLDSGNIMQRTDSQSYNGGSGFSNNNIIGSAMTGGSSGGPWLANFGVRPTGYVNGVYPNRSAVVGVTSWGYVSSAVKEQGASPFTSGNISILVSSACGSFPAAC